MSNDDDVVEPHELPGALLRRLLLFALIAGVLIAGAAGVLYWQGNAPAEIAELLGEGGEKVLREPMRPARGAPRVLVFALDGVGDGELRQAIAAGAMPRVSALLGRETEPRLYEHGWAAPGVLSILPSTTYAAWASVFTGQPAARTGVPGNEWFAREEMRFYAPAPTTVTQHRHAVQVFSDQLMGRLLRAPTVYERAGVRAYVSLQAYHRGADLLAVPMPSSYGRMVRQAAKGVAETDETASQGVYRELDARGVESLLASIRRHGMADLQVVYFPGVDLYTHVAQDPLPDQLRYLRNVVDPAVGQVLDAYRGAGALDGTWVMFVADHGHTPVLPDDRHALSAEGADEPPQVLRQAGFRVRPLELELDDEEQDFQAVVAYQGAMAYVYLADRSTCPRPGGRCDWNRPPRLEEDVLAVVRAFHQASATGAGVPALRGASTCPATRAPTCWTSSAGWRASPPARTATAPATCCCWRGRGWRCRSSSASTSPAATTPGTAAPARRTARSRCWWRTPAPPAPPSATASSAPPVPVPTSSASLQSFWTCWAPGKASYRRSRARRGGMIMADTCLRVNRRFMQAY
jgi:hypothetical protein